MDLKMNDKRGDIIFENGGCPMTEGIADNVAQRLTIRLRTALGEWFRNTNYGVPWFQRVLGKKVNKTSVDIVIQDQIRKDRYVTQIISFTSSLNPVSREYSCTFRVRCKGGMTEEIYFSIEDLGD